MRRLSPFLCSALAIAICGCAGSGGQSASFQPGYYRGTVQSTGSPYLGSGTGPVVLDLQENGSFEAHGKIASSLPAFANGSGGGVLQVGLSAFLGTVTENGSNGTFSFTLRINGGVVATATVTQSPLPSLGNTASVPPSGSYSGDLVIISNGHARDYGSATATVDASGRITANMYASGGWVDGGVFGGDMLADGSFSDAMLGAMGGLYPQTTPQFSFDGTTLILRLDQLRLEPGTCWITLRHD